MLKINHKEINNILFVSPRDCRKFVSNFSNRTKFLFKLNTVNNKRILFHRKLTDSKD